MVFALITFTFITLALIGLPYVYRTKEPSKYFLIAALDILLVGGGVAVSHQHHLLGWSFIPLIAAILVLVYIGINWRKRHLI